MFTLTYLHEHFHQEAHQLCVMTSGSGGVQLPSLCSVCWWGLHEMPEPDLSHEPIQGWGAAGNPLSTVSQTCHLPARNADESPFHHETRHQATSCQEHPKCTPALASALCPWIVYILGLGSESRGAYGFRKRQPDPVRHTRVLGTRKIVGGLQGNDFMPAKGHQVRRKKQEPSPCTAATSAALPSCSGMG